MTIPGGRKFALSVGCGVVTSCLLWFGKLGSGEYATIIVATIAAYITGGTVDNIKGKSSE